MTKTILAEVDGWTPLIDILVANHSLVRAAVFGRIWRYCEMSEGECRAPLKKIANRLGISYRTVLRHIKALVDDGYLEDLTPDLRNRPHRYRETGKAGIRVKIEAFPTRSESPSTMTLSQSAMTESPTGSDSKSHEDTIKKQVKKQVKKKRKTRKPDPLFDAIADVCQCDPKLNGSSIAKVRHKLFDAGYTVKDVFDFGHWWNSDEWRFKKGPPTIWKLLDQIKHAQPEDRSKKILEESNVEARMKMLEEENNDE